MILRLELLVRTAVSQAKAGADIIAPSNMMDGYVHAIRTGLDEAGYENTRLWRIPSNMHLPITVHSVMLRIHHRNSVIGKRIKWTLRIVVKRFVRQQAM